MAANVLTLTEVTRAMLWAVARPKLKQHLVVPRFHPEKWTECDLFELTQAGYFREYELKTTLGDFRDDKNKSFRRRGKAGWEALNKHEMLAKGCPLGPRQFWFVVPDGLVEPADVPEWAGLIAVTRIGYAYPSAIERKKAPIRHSQVVSEACRQAVYVSAYWRFVRSLWGGPCQVRGMLPPSLMKRESSDQDPKGLRRLRGVVPPSVGAGEPDLSVPGPGDVRGM